VADLEIIIPTTASDPQAPPLTPRTVTPRFTWMDFWLVVLMVIWGSNFVILKSALHILPPFILNGMRFSAGTVALWIIFSSQRINLVMPRHEWMPIIALTFFNQVVYQGVWLWSLHHTTVANNALILTTVPVWIVMFNAWRGHERLSRRGTIGIFIALVGVFVVIAGGGKIALGGDTLAGDIMTVISAVIWAVTILWSRRILARNEPMPVAFWTVAWGAIFQLIIAVPDFVRIDWRVFQPNLLIAMLYSGMISIGIGSMIWNRAINKMGTGRPAIYTYLEPVIAALSAVIFLHEPFTVLLLVGGALVMVGVLSVKSA
jgi:drug/metabolite transporter (DMT)-like permease